MILLDDDRWLGGLAAADLLPVCSLGVNRAAYSLNT